ncbi:MAG: hypothetical protein KDD45_03075, partial [Bdellovibrionales bacterium]|nr:hypothetical protein [Bdellovibrionales bacterium]
MRNWFVISFAVMAFLVACGKKVKKQGDIGKAAAPTAQADCNGKDKDSVECKNNQDTTPHVDGDKASGEDGPQATGSGSAAPAGNTTTDNTTDTFPNEANSKVGSVKKKKNKALMGSFAISANTNDLSNLTVTCADISEINKNPLVEQIINPDKLDKTTAKLFLLNDSQILASMKIAKGPGAGVQKPYLVSCKNDIQYNLDTLKKASDVYQVREMNEGENVIDMLAVYGKSDEGILTSFECSTSEKILKKKKKLTT